jgi:phenylpyruvate tautomerase PptA (4-oxalocrotonate tautomerase family)
MPYVQIATTKTLTGKEKSELKACVFSAAALLGKPRQYVMVHIADGQALHKGDNEDNAAFCDARILGAASVSARDKFAAKLSEDIARIAETAPTGVYLMIQELSSVYMDGVNLGGH